MANAGAPRRKNPTSARLPKWLEYGHSAIGYFYFATSHSTLKIAESWCGTNRRRHRLSVSFFCLRKLRRGGPKRNGKSCSSKAGFQEHQTRRATYLANC